jgi:HAD superfamily hydrolase (TIGR01509 family)
MPALLFGSIGTVAETSELQRAAFNEAFAAHDLDWEWSQDEYQHLLEKSGGEKRIAEYAAEKGDDVDAAAVYATKSELFQKKLADSHPGARPGVAETIAAAKDDGYKVALVTTTSRENVEALGAGIEPLSLDDFDLTVDKSEVSDPKPDSAAYRYAVDKLGVEPAECVAIENNLDGVSAAKAAGLTCVAFPGEDNAGHGFDGADEQVETLSFDELRSLVQGS